jgi:hypothetical protein
MDRKHIENEYEARISERMFSMDEGGFFDPPALRDADGGLASDEDMDRLWRAAMTSLIDEDEESDFNDYLRSRLSA